MAHRTMTYGFWLALGLAGGALLSDLVRPQPLAASANTSRVENDLVAVGTGQNPDIELVWVLDYEGAALNCISMNRNGRLGGVARIDLDKLFDPKTFTGDPKFMMVTGRFIAQEIADVVYVFEQSSQQVAVVATPLQIDPNGRPLSQPRLLTTFKYRG